ncbi:Uncharacterized protein conserved in bacteria [Yersinia enterocolitica]|uniref:AAA family ATPase n=1 Tax=Yersinia enterocolitica TaxID=630 RepID=UPI000659658F|nr:AAA family ATPase [Yersinia enterocolitica]EKN3439341.1 AAA family ATPase [Yersinia enterocolitica]EKN3503496.1 AAA family ATPase [Yersinia enterocolitica]EKN4047946.1 AAA family ATPase [Yersinia enterocolitica]EKN4758821.1 AAA family ATPase [Yersinia enterocolitica]EKN4858044.1 AAA family ATPase [Yersinia enterocolitica]
MFKKISKIKNIAVYNNFIWDNEVKESNGQISEFRTVNILYGRNYSGKTTLSRIFRSLETNMLSDKYKKPEFNLETLDGESISQLNIGHHNLNIRVFNEDFIKDNLKFISNSDESINSFAILGENNKNLIDEINIKEFELGREDDKSSKLGKCLESKEQHIALKRQYSNSNASLDEKLTEKANNKKTGIKHNSRFGDANYNRTKLQTDIDLVLNGKYHPISDIETLGLETLLKEDVKERISQLPILILSLTNLLQKTKYLVEKEISAAKPIDELLKDHALESWVRTARAFHENKRNTCGFCGSKLSVDIWARLDQHFNKESEKLHNDIDNLIVDIKNERKKISELLNVSMADYYSKFNIEISSINENAKKVKDEYISSLDKLVSYLAKRKMNIFSANKLEEISDCSENFRSLYSKLDEVNIQSNNFTLKLSSEKEYAKKTLRLNEVFRFVNDINYVAEKDKLNILCTDVSNALKRTNSIAAEIALTRQKIAILKAKMNDESKGADSVNIYLNNFFGHKSLSLQAKENENGFKFEVVRNEEKAHHLSEGECSLIAFCYFMAKLKDTKTKNLKPIIYIDDPISSLDNNHIFFIFSLINSEIVKVRDFSQLFISTHNLEFLKYLKRIAPKDSANKTIERKYFIIERVASGSSIKTMPKYLKNYVTEFNYLFHQVFKCANAVDTIVDEQHDCYYNYGNNARKFLESFLYFKYPNANEKDNTKLERFFGFDSLSTVITERITNEYSHLEGVFERSTSPIDVPEMRRSAQFILRKIREKDPEQYSALLESIDNPIETF